MPNLISLRTLALATALAGALAAPAARAAEEPFTATAMTKETITPVAPGLCPVNLAGVTLGRGTSSAMGTIAVAAADCITPTSTSTFEFTNGRMALTGASGEQLFFGYDGNLTVVSIDGTATLDGSYRVLGGTGRFWGASGSGKLTGTLNMTTLVGQMILTGKLNTR